MNRRKILDLCSNSVDKGTVKSIKHHVMPTFCLQQGVLSAVVCSTVVVKTQTGSQFCRKMIA